MHLLWRISIACALTCVSAAAVCADGTILFDRSVETASGGTSTQTGSLLFTIDDKGHHLRQLTPALPKVYFKGDGDITSPNPYLSSNPGFMTRNFSSRGHFIQYFAGQPSSSDANGGKYYVMDVFARRSWPLFSGSDDNAPPGVGYLAWGPAGTHEIAYVNSTSEIPISPACVYLIHPDGSGKRLLWCAPANEQTPEGPMPILAVSFLRWSGNGKKLLAFASYQEPGLALPKRGATTQPVGGTGFAALYEIDVQTGAAIEVAGNNPDAPLAGISYDGTKVLYQQYDAKGCGDDDPFAQSLGVSLCLQDVTAGKVTSLFPSDEWVFVSRSGAVQLSPDGSQVVFNLYYYFSDWNEQELFVMNTDGTNLTQLTHSSGVAWVPVAWSPDGKQVLVNRIGGNVPSEIHIITVSDQKDRLVTTNASALDWYRKK